MLRSARTQACKNTTGRLLHANPCFHSGLQVYLFMRHSLASKCAASFPLLLNFRSETCFSRATGSRDKEKGGGGSRGEWDQCNASKQV